MGRKKKGKSAKKARLGQTTSGEESYKRCPHSFVFHRGHVGKNVGQLIMDMRRVMEPFTASHLKARRKNVLKDFVSVAGLLNVTHFITFSKTEVTTNMKVMRLPRGPTLTFRVHQYSLAKDVISSLKKFNMEPKQFKHHPLLVMNNFSGEGLHFKLMSTMFQNMFPPVNVNKVKLSDVRRCVLLNYSHEDKTIEFRHYNIRVVPLGMSRGVKKLVRAKVPNMSKYDDISEYLLRAGELSESEAELDGPDNEVTLPQDMSSRGNMKAAKSAIRLTEIGPRMKLQLVKIEDGLCAGDILFHEFIEKTPEELQMQRKMREAKRKLKEQRKQKQEADMRKKEQQKEDHKQKSLAGMKRGQSQEDEDSDSDVERPGDDDEDWESAAEDSEQDDINYYRQEVGDEPEPELFPSATNKPLKRKKSQSSSHQQAKKAKTTPKARGTVPRKQESGAPGKKTAKNKGQKEDSKKQKKPLTDLDRIKRRKLRQGKKKELALKMRKKGGRTFSRKR